MTVCAQCMYNWKMSRHASLFENIEPDFELVELEDIEDGDHVALRGILNIFVVKILSS